jgi:hypothetical protein
MPTKLIELRISPHREGADLLVVQAPDVAGFLMHGHDEEELAARLGSSLAAFLRALGQPVEDVTIERDTESEIADFWPSIYKAIVHLTDRVSSDVRRIRGSDTPTVSAQG